MHYVFTTIYDIDPRELEKDHVVVKAVFPKEIIAPNTYYFRVVVFNDSQIYENLENICHVRVADTGTLLSKYEGVNYGSVIIHPDWSIKQ